jgi:hypothetical protein
MNYASNDEIFQEILDIEGLGRWQIQRRAEVPNRLHGDLCSYHQGVSTGFIESTRSLTTQTETV